MIVLDVNILLYAYDATAPLHDRARSWLEGAFSGEEPIGLPWQTVSAFFRIATNSRISSHHVTPQEAAIVIDRWLEHPLVVLLTPGDHHWPLLRQMVIEGQAHGPRVTDAHLAALAIENGGVLYSVDRDFARFPGLRWVNPLAEAL